ncbi:hypothetical protein WJX74_003788 [Apatococcus lobatus]|uniref:Uncharacterized protein n=1 Tax=Apatococcus lobatus TaxID=904363 RepID=A0AAW1QDP2_9CHLO
MPPKAKKGPAGKGKQKSVKEPERPSWLSDEAWKVSKDVTRLVEKLRGAADKGPQGVSRAQASVMLWQLLYPPGGARTERQLDALKLNAIEAAMKTVGGGQPMEAAAAAGVTCAMLAAEGAADQVLKQSAVYIPVLLRAIAKGTPGGAAPALGVLQQLAEGPASRLRLMRALEPLDWSPLVHALSWPPDALGAGGRVACVNAAFLLKALILPAEPKVEEPAAAKAEAAKSKGGKAAAPARPATSGKDAKGAGTDPKAKPVLPVPAALKESMMTQLQAAQGIKALLQMIGRPHASALAKHAAIEIITAALQQQPSEMTQLISSDSHLAGICTVLGDVQASLPLKASTAALLKNFLAQEGIASPPPALPAAAGLSAIVSTSGGPAGVRTMPPDANAIGGFPPGRRPSKSRMTTITVMDHAAASSRRNSGATQALPGDVRKGPEGQPLDSRAASLWDPNVSHNNSIDGPSSRRATLREQLQAGPPIQSLKHRLASVTWRTKSLAMDSTELKAALAGSQPASNLSPAMQSLVTAEDSWSDSVLSKTAQQATARGFGGDIASVWQDIQRRSVLGPGTSHASSPRREWAPEINPITPYEPPPGMQQVLFEDVFLDTDKRNEALIRVQLVARAGGLSPLINLCGTPPAPAAKPTEAGTAGKKKKPVKKGKVQLPAGLAHAQSNAAACLRLMSMSDANKRNIMNLGGDLKLLPLLTNADNVTRWSARQALLHLAMLSEHTEALKAHGVPDYISGANIMRAARRPLTAPAMLESEAFHRALLGPTPPRNLSTAPPALKSSSTRGPDSSMGVRDGSLVPTLALGKRASALGLEAMQGRLVSTDRSAGLVPMSRRGSTLAGIATDVREFQAANVAADNGAVPFASAMS